MALKLLGRGTWAEFTWLSVGVKQLANMSITSVSFEVFTVVWLRIPFFWYVTLCHIFEEWK
jgi:hypothetical protein